MTWHLGSFSMFAFANILWLILQITDFDQLNLRKIAGFKVNLIAETLTIICVFLAELPLLHILNSIISKGILDQREDEYKSGDFQSQYKS